MLKLSEDPDKTMRSIQTIITDGERGKEIDHPKTTFIHDSDKKTLRKTQKTKAKTKRYHSHDVRYKAKL